MEKNYIVFKDGRVGYIKDICTCNNCKARNQAEMFINDLDNVYMDCIEINNVKDILYIGTSLANGIETLVEYYESLIHTEKLGNKFLQSVLNFYSKKIISE